MKGIMKRRYGITALFTLIALVLSFTGTAFASACASAPDARAGAASHAEHEGMPGNPAHDHDSNQSMPDCPLSMLAGCATAPSLAADASITLVAAAEIVIAAAAPEDVLEHIRTNIIFHPPRF